MTGSASLCMPKFISIEDNTTTSVSRQESTLRVISYNILAQVYVKSASFPHSPSACLRWKARSQAILSHLLSFNADVLCIQELDEFENFYKEKMDNEGYSSVYVKRTGRKRDGCGIFFRRGRVALVSKEVIDYNDLVPYDSRGVNPSNLTANPENENASSLKAGSPGKDSAATSIVENRDPNDPLVRLKRDCVGIMAAFRLDTAPQHLIVVANTHLYWDPDWADVKLAQAKYLVSRVLDYQIVWAKEYQCRPFVIICGDFNSTPGDQVYEFLTSGIVVDETLMSDQCRDPNSSTGGLTSIVMSKQSLPGTENVLQAKRSTKDNASICCPLPLRSLYASAKGEPDFTNCTPGFTGTLDYIFFCPSENLSPSSFLELPSSSSKDLVGGLPNHNHPSDHLPIGGEFVIHQQDFTRT